MQRTAVFVAVAIGFATSAAAQKPLRFNIEPVEFTLTAVCGFDVEVSDVRVHGNDIVFFDSQDNLTKEIVAGNFVSTYTNATTGESLTLNISGQFFFTQNADGSLAVAGHGRNVFATAAPEPLLVFRRGYSGATITFTEESFELVLNETRGGGFDVCEALAGPG